MVKNYYEILGVEHDATEEDIKSAYRRLARKYHPDVSEEENAKERFQEVAKAYEILGDAAKRAHYDANGSDGPAPLESEARQMVCGMILDWIFQHGDEPYANMKAHLRRLLAEQDCAAVQNVKQGENILASTRRALKRLKYKGDGHDYVRSALETRVEDVERKIELAKLNVERVRLATDLATAYDYESPLSDLMQAFDTGMVVRRGPSVLDLPPPPPFKP